MRRFRWGFWLLLLVLALLGMLFLRLMNPDVAGFLYDDGIYLMAAQSLADGHGYRLDGITGQPFLYKYPPLYPSVLAFSLRLLPSFPNCIAWLKALNIMLTLGALALFWRYALHVRQFTLLPSLLLVAWLGTNRHLAEVSVELMSEPLYLLLSLGTILLCACPGKDLAPHRLTAVILLSVAAFYTRSVGLILVVALASTFWLRGERKTAVLFLGSCMLLMVPWLWWSLGQPLTTENTGAFLVRSFQESYFRSFLMDLRHETSLPALYAGGVSELLGNFAIHFAPLAERLLLGPRSPWGELSLLGGSFALALPLGVLAYRSLRLRQFTPEGLYVGLYLLVLPFWSFHRFYPRFLVVILPLLAVMLLSFLAGKAGSRKQLMLSAVLGLGILLNLAGLASYLDKPTRNTLAVGVPVEWWSEYAAVFAGLRAKAKPGERVYTDNGDESFFWALNTGLPAADFFLYLPKEKLPAVPTVESMHHLLAARGEALYGQLKKQRIAYFVANRGAVLKSPINSRYPARKETTATEALLRNHPEAFSSLLQSPAGWVTVYRFQP